MLPLQGFYGFELSNQNGFIQRLRPTKPMEGGDSTLSSGSKEESRSIEAASKSHKEAERRRRQRINAHLSTLRSLLPNTIKTDKASLLAEVVHRVKELKKQATEIERQDGDSCSRRSESGFESWPFPGELDETTLSHCDGGGVKVTLCCEDRPDFNRDLAEAIRSVGARAIRAEMTTIGGRTRSVVVMQWVDGGTEQIGPLKRALKAVVENRASGHGLGNKRARF